MFEYLREINQHIWDSNYEQAFKELEAFTDDSPRACLELAFAKVQIGMFTGDSVTRSLVIEYVQQAEKLIKKYKQKGEMDAYISKIKKWNAPYEENNDALKEFHKTIDWEYNVSMDHTLVSAEGNLLKAVMYYSLNSPLKAGKSIISGYNAFKRLYYNDVAQSQAKLQEKHNGVLPINTLPPDSKLHGCLHHSILFGFGVLNYLLSMLPPYVVSVLSIFGFESDRDRGMELMHLCADYDAPIRRGAAQLVLGSPYVFVPSEVQTIEEKNAKLDRYAPLIESALKRYPSGTMVAYVASQYYTVRGQLDKAVEHMRIAVDSAKKAGYAPMRFSYDLGQYLAVSCRFDEAIVIFDEIVKYDGDVNIRAIACLYLAGCKVLTGAPSTEVVALLRSLGDHLSKHSRIDRAIQEINSDFISSLSDDQLILAAPILMFEFIYGMRHLYNISENEALSQEVSKVFTKLANKILVKKDMKDLKPACSVIRCRLLRNIGEHEKAKAILDKLEQSSFSSAHARLWITMSHWERAEMFFSENNYSDAIKNFQAIGSHKSSYLDELFKSRAKSAIKKIQQK
mmetsp:Transcript_2411/g.3505  ORF Transcript_2411/g.3505 Transcript_2411/m.3505 type:complete len:568 (-) Transcript_2411:2-1705(-)